MKTWTLTLLLSAISSSVLISNAMAEETQHTTTPYSVVDGNKLDTNSYKGFKLFRNWCARCHGTYGQGMVGPNLADSLKIISKEEFYATVENGKTGTIGSMPAWKSNEKVMEGRDSLYAYLKARSDGAIGEVKPSKQK
jgi:mono/diheme cytochrome c family protein